MADTKMKQVYVELTIPKGKWFPIISWIIRLIQKRKGMKFKDVPSHVRLKFYAKNQDVWWIYEASQTKVKFIGDNQWAPKVSVIKSYELYVPHMVRTKMIARAGKTTGKPYGSIDLVGRGWVLINRFFGKKVKNPLSDGNKAEVCVETLWETLHEIPSLVPILKEYDPNTMDVCDIINIMKDGGY